MALICISGCSDSKTVDYYYNHQLEAREKVKECQKEEGGLKSSETCMNAIHAVRKWANRKASASIDELGADNRTFRSYGK
jgi:hypothetical protein